MAIEIEYKATTPNKLKSIISFEKCQASKNITKNELINHVGIFGC